MRPSVFVITPAAALLKASGEQAPIYAQFTDEGLYSVSLQSRTFEHHSLSDSSSSPRANCVLHRLRLPVPHSLGCHIAFYI